MLGVQNVAVISDPLAFLRRHPPGSVLYLPGFEGGQSTIRDYSGKGNDGVITDAIWKPLPNKQKGLWYLDFDGTDDRIDCGSAASIKPDTWTIEAWVKPVAKTGQVLIGWAATFPAAYINLSGANSAVYMAVGNIRYFNVAAYNKLIDGSWHHVAFTLPGAGQEDIEDCQMYIDGVLQVTSTTISTAAQTAKGTCRLGADRAAGATNHLLGGLALARLSNSVIPVPILQEHYNQERHLFGV